MWKDKYYSAKVPVTMAILFVVNVILFILLEILIVYPYPDQLDAAILAEIDPMYAGCTVIASDDVSELTCYLVETADGHRQILSTRRHIFGRSKLLKPIAVDAFSGDLDLRDGIHTHRVHVDRDSINITYFSHSGKPVRYLLFPALMGAVEFLVVGFIKKRLQ